MVRLHLGCGKKRFPGFVNIDLARCNPDLAADIRKLPFPDDHADEIWAIHVIEHFYAWEVHDVLTEWKRVLKPGGRLVLEMPDLDKVVKHLQSPEAPIHLTLWPLYGDPRHRNPEDVHKWCYNPQSMGALLESVGFRDIEFKPAQYHVIHRDFRAEARKDNGSTGQDSHRD